MLRKIAVAAVAALLSACINVVTVKAVDTKTLEAECAKRKEQRSAGFKADCDGAPGIPFYIKKEQFRKTTVYADTWLRATLTVETKLVDSKDGKEVLIDAGKQLYTKNIPKPPGEGITKLKTALLRAHHADQTLAESLISDFQALPDVDVTEPNATVMKNSVSSEWVVDRSRTYYLNAPLPWFGTGSLTQELSGDGTLSKATVTADTKVAEGLSTIIPFKEYLTGKFVTPAPAAAATNATTQMLLTQALREFEDKPKPTLVGKLYVYVLSLNLDEVGYEYTLTGQPEVGPIMDLTPLSIADVKSHKANFSRKTIGGWDKAETDEGQEVGISGKVSFPKDWGAAKPAEK